MTSYVTAPSFHRNVNLGCIPAFYKIVAPMFFFTLERVLNKLEIVVH